jgi:ribosomal protein S12 methylthiotransferase accessory factor
MTSPTDLLPGVGEPVPKGYWRGTHRAVAPEATVARLRPLWPALGITRLANVTGLDRIGIPVVVACRPNSRSLAVAQGKGLDLAAARASALMESVEAWHAERITLPLKLASYEELRYTHRLADVTGLPRTHRSTFHRDLALLWSEGYDLLQQEPVWVPYELVHTNYTLPHPSGSGCFTPTSNGLASGNHPLEALSHAICEVVERDATTLWHLLDRDAQAATRLDLATVDDAACCAVVERYARAGVAVAVWESTTDLGIAAFVCFVTERDADPLHPLYSTGGFGCHPRRDVALLRALTEAAQSRLTLIAGSRDDLPRRSYELLLEPRAAERQRALILGDVPRRRYADVPTFEGDTFDADVAWELERLRAAGLQQVIAVDLTRREIRVPVVRVVIPGLEGVSGQPGYAHGARARALLAAAP